MPADYSLDLHRKVMDAIDKGMSITTASNTFCFSRNSIHLWRKPLRSLKVTTGYDTILIIIRSETWNTLLGSCPIEEIEHNRSWVVNTKVVGKALKKLRWTKKRSLSLQIKRWSKNREISAGASKHQLREVVTLKGRWTLALWRLG